MYLFNFIVIKFFYILYFTNNAVSLEMAQTPRDKVQGAKFISCRMNTGFNTNHDCFSATFVHSSTYLTYVIELDFW
jgi:hypothetical protein